MGPGHRHGPGHGHGYGHGPGHRHGPPSWTWAVLSLGPRPQPQKHLYPRGSPVLGAGPGRADARASAAEAVCEPRPRPQPPGTAQPEMGAEAPTRCPGPAPSRRASCSGGVVCVHACAHARVRVHARALCTPVYVSAPVWTEVDTCWGGGARRSGCRLAPPAAPGRRPGEPRENPRAPCPGRRPFHVAPTRLVWYPGFQRPISKTIPQSLVSTGIRASVRSSARGANPHAHAHTRKLNGARGRSPGADGVTGLRGHTRSPPPGHTHGRLLFWSCSGGPPRCPAVLPAQLGVPVPPPRPCHAASRSEAPTQPGPAQNTLAGQLALLLARAPGLHPRPGHSLSRPRAEQPRPQRPSGGQVNAGPPTGRAPACQAQVSGCDGGNLERQ